MTALVLEKPTLRQKVEAYINTATNILIGSVSLYTIWQCYHVGNTTYTKHVWMSTFGVSRTRRGLEGSIHGHKHFSTSC